MATPHDKAPLDIRPHRTQPDTAHTLASHSHKQTPHTEMTETLLSEKFGIKSSTQLNHFLSSHEGKALLTEIKAEEAVKQYLEATSLEEAMAAAAKFRNDLISALVKRTEGRDHNQALREEAAALVRELVLGEEPAQPKEAQKVDRFDEYLDVVHDLTEEIHELEATEETLDVELDDLKQIEDEVLGLIETIPKPQPKKDLASTAPEAVQEDEMDFQNQLNALKDYLQKQIASIEQSLAQSDLAPTDQPTAAPTPKPKPQQSGQQAPQSKSQLQQIQSMRKGFCQSMIQAINKHLSPGDQPTEGHIAVQREHHNRESDLNGIRTQILEHNQFLRNDHIPNAAKALKLQKSAISGQKASAINLKSALEKSIAAGKTKERYDTSVSAFKARATASKAATPETPHQSPTPGRK